MYKVVTVVSLGWAIASILMALQVVTTADTSVLNRDFVEFLILCLGASTALVIASDFNSK